MTPREETARRFAEAVGWRVYEDSAFVGLWFLVDPQNGINVTEEQAEDRLVWLPSPDAPLRELLEFVGRVAEAVGAKDVRISWSVGMAACVKFAPLDGRTNYSAPDLCHAAMLAGIAAKEGRK